MKRFLMPLGASLVVIALAGVPARAGEEVATLESATHVVHAFSDITIRRIPPALLRDAKAVAIIPHVVKAGLVIGGRFGRGVILPRLPNGCWGEPVFITLTGGGIGLQVGVQSTDVILVFKTGHALDRILQGRGKITLGGDVAVAAGPIGRQAEVATDAELRAEIFSYSRSRGLFAGVSLEGAGLHAEAEANAIFHSRPTAPGMAALAGLKAELDQLSAPPAVPVVYPAPTLPPPAPVPVPVPVRP